MKWMADVNPRSVAHMVLEVVGIGSDVGYVLPPDCQVTGGLVPIGKRNLECCSDCWVAYKDLTRLQRPPAV